jgi:hypothetical protein
MDIDKQIEDILYYIQLYTDCTNYQKSRILQVLLTHWKPIEVEKIIYVEKIVYQNQKVKYIPIDNIDAYIANFCDTNGITPDYLKKKDRSTSYIKIRQKFCFEAYKYGFMLCEIGGALNLHHSTIMHYLKLKNETTNQPA